MVFPSDPFPPVPFLAIKYHPLGLVWIQTLKTFGFIETACPP